jgi:hypothetical protein
MSKTIAVEPAPVAPVETILPTNWTPAQVEAFRQSQNLRSTWTRRRLTREIEAIYRMDPAESERDWQMVSEWMRSQPSASRPKPATKPSAPAVPESGLLWSGQAAALARVRNQSFANAVRGGKVVPAAMTYNPNCRRVVGQYRREDVLAWASTFKRRAS